MEVSGQPHAPAALPPGKLSPVPTGWEAGRTQSRPGRNAVDMATRLRAGRPGSRGSIPGREKKTSKC
jgi:hypothetical protein